MRVNIVQCWFLVAILICDRRIFMFDTIPNLNFFGKSGTTIHGTPTERSNGYNDTVRRAICVFNEIRDEITRSKGIKDKSTPSKNSWYINRLQTQLFNVLDIYQKESLYGDIAVTLSVDRLISQARESFRALENTFIFSPTDYIPDTPSYPLSRQDKLKRMIEINVQLYCVKLIVSIYKGIISNDTSISKDVQEKELLLIARIAQLKLHHHYCSFYWIISQPQTESSYFPEANENYDCLKTVIPLELDRINGLINETLNKAKSYRFPNESFELMKTTPPVHEEMTPDRRSLNELAESMATWMKSHKVEEKLKRDALTKTQVDLFSESIRQDVSSPLQYLVELHKTIGDTKEKSQDFFATVSPDETAGQFLEVLHKLHIRLNMLINQYPLVLNAESSNKSIADIKNQMYDVLIKCNHIIERLDAVAQGKHKSIYDGLEVLFTPNRTRLEYIELTDPVEGQIPSFTK